MLEIYYAIYKNQTIEGLLFTIIATILSNGIGSISNSRIHFDKILFPKEINCLFDKIKTNKENWVNWNDIVKIKVYLISEMLKCGFLIKLPIIGYINSFKFYKYINRNKHSVSVNIKNYIDKSNIDYLGEINNEILNIRFKFPDFDGFDSFFAGSGDMALQHANIETGKWDFDRYKEYYDINGKKHKI